jgi:hypothetical protein
MRNFQSLKLGRGYPNSCFKVQLNDIVNNLDQNGTIKREKMKVNSVSRLKLIVSKAKKYE